MRIRTPRFVLAALVVVLSLFSLTVSSDEPATLVLRGATVFTTATDQPIENATVVIKGNRICKVGPADKITFATTAEVIDLTGHYITAGFWNSHVHFTGQLEPSVVNKARFGALLSDTFLRWGFVDTVDTGSWLAKTLEARHRIERGDFFGPRILTAGGSLYPKVAAPFTSNQLYYLNSKAPWVRRNRSNTHCAVVLMPLRFFPAPGPLPRKSF